MNGRERVYLSLGGNLGDRAANLRAAIERLGALEGAAVRAASRVYETEPLGYAGQPEFLNQAVEIETAFEPLELLNAVQAIEKRLGRTPGERWGPRVIDIDIVLWGERTLVSERLTVPHPAFRERAFVLEPLSEIAPDARDPVTGLSVAALRARLEDQGPGPRIRLFDH